MIDEDDDTGADRREAWERLKVYTAWAQISRAWVTTMDAKAAFISGMDGALVAFLWAGVGFAQVRGLPQWLALGSTALAGLSLWFALAVVLPRTAVSAEVAARSAGRTGAGPLSYFGFVASAYPAGRFEQFADLGGGNDA